MGLGEVEREDSTALRRWERTETAGLNSGH